jgi:hypothetical protein
MGTGSIGTPMARNKATFMTTMDYSSPGYGKKKQREDII